jgi:hypothetical protein
MAISNYSISGYYINGGEYFINGYWCLFYQWLLVPILSMAIGAYFINGYWCLFYQWLLVPILLMAIGAYSINGYWLLFY